MSWGAEPSKKLNTYHFRTEWEEDFFYYVFIEVRLPHLPVCHRITEEGKCGAVFSDCS